MASWNDDLQRGSHANFHWVVLKRRLRKLPEFLIRCHQGLHLCIAAFDGSLITPTPEEGAEGWTRQGEVMVSPPLTDAVKVPYGIDDEWCFLEHPKFEFRVIEQFVGYHAFTLIDVQEIYDSFDSTWEKGGWDWLPVVQEKFWRQILQINPMTYAVLGDIDVIVSRNLDLIEKIAKDQ